jgi:hypothetical protein
VTEPEPEDDQVRQRLARAARAALAANVAMRQRDAEIQVQAQAIIDSTLTSLTQSQLIATLKDLARGVEALAGQNVQVTRQLDGLIRLI